MKVIAYYLPQYHEIKENNEWWGKGYTEWDSVKRGRVLTNNQYQPRIPLNNNYYDLSDLNVMRWQVELAKRYGIYGFCVYHYWFNGKLLLEKPMENYLKSDISFPFFFCWANENWTNIWEGNLKEIKTLIAHNYENKKDWKKHFEYFLPFFKDDRYIKENNKPLLSIYDPVLCKHHTLSKMMKYWNDLAIENGFNGICYLFQSSRSYTLMGEKDRKMFDYEIEYQPGLIDKLKDKRVTRIKNFWLNRVSSFLRKINVSILDKKVDCEAGDYDVKIKEDYDCVWKEILSIQPRGNKTLPGAFVDWDNTPRRMKQGKVILGSSPEKFHSYFLQQVGRAAKVYNKDLIFIFAWNEWSEGGYLEPDERYGTKYLEAIKSVLEATNELPKQNEAFFVERVKNERNN